MKKVIRLTESDLVRIVKRIINEETESTTTIPFAFLMTNNFKKSTRFSVDLGGEGGRQDSGSPKNAVCYKSGVCPTKSASNPWMKFTEVHLEFDIPNSIVYVLVAKMDKDKKIKGTSTGKVEISKLESYLKNEKSLNSVSYGC